MAQPRPRPVRRRRFERTIVERHGLIQYGYGLHYGVFTFILLMMSLAGCFKKGDNTVELEYLSYKVPDAECSPLIEIWYCFFIVGCPIAMVIGIILYYVAKKHRNFHAYTFETRYVYYEIWTNNDRKINWPFIGIEIYNIVWAIVGSLLNTMLDSVSPLGGAINDCMKNYGLTYVLMGYSFMAFSYLHLLRFALWILVIMNH